MTTASSKLAKAQEVAALKGLRAAVPFYVEATDALATEGRCDAAVGVLAEVLNAREKKRSLFGSKEVNPLGPDRPALARQFARMTRCGTTINDDLLELLSQIAIENPDDPDVRLANAEGLYRAGYMADAIDEYRYCQKLIPDDGALVARLGELYGVMNRNAEAVDYLRQGIGELMQAHHFGDIAFFCHKLIDLSPQAANDVQRWVGSLPDEALQQQRTELNSLIESVYDKGLDDGYWSTLENRLSALPELKPASRAAAIETEPAAADHAMQVEEPVTSSSLVEHRPVDEPEPIWGSKTGNVQIGRNAWADVANVEPASEDEMRMLLGPAAHQASEPATEAEDAGEPAVSATEPVSAASSNGVSAEPSPARAPQPPAQNLPPGLAAFTRRKADAAFNAGDFAGAAQSYERLLKSGFDADVGSPLLECYLGTERFDDASAIALQLADHYVAAGNRARAVAALALVLEHTNNPDIERRHAELLAAK